MSILAGLLVASAGMARAGRLGFFRASAEKSTVRHESTTCAPDDEGTSDDQGTTEEEGSDDQSASQDESISEDKVAKDEGSSEECEDPEEGDGTTGPGEGDETTQPGASGDPADREAECNEAAGVSPAGEDEEGSEGSEGDVETTGLDHAVEVVLANCIKNPQAPGLVNALRHLVANRDRHLAHQAEMAARRAAREAARAAGHGAHGRGHGKGPK